MNNKKKILSHAVLILLLVSAFPLVVHVSSENVSAAPDTHTWDGGGADAFAGTHANWVTNIAPEAGDSVIFDAGALPCTWNLSIALNAFSITAGYTGTITQGASFSVTSYSQAAGTFTGNQLYVLTDSSNFIQTGGTITGGSALRLQLSGTESVSLQVTADCAFYSLDTSGNVTITSTASQSIGGANGGLSIGSGKTLAIGAPGFNIVTYGAMYFTNLGTIVGSGTLLLSMRSSDETWTLGAINCPLLVEARASCTASRALTVGGTVILGSSLAVDSLHATNTMTLDLSTSNYALSCTDLTIGTRGILNGSASAITSSGNWDSSAGTFNANKSTLTMTGTGKTIKTANTNGGLYDFQVSGTVSTLSSLNVSHNLTVDVDKTLTIASGNTLTLGAGGNASISGNVISAGNWDSSNATLVSGSGSIYVTGAGSFYKSNGGGMASSLIVNGTSDRLITASGRLANSLTVNSGGSLSLQNDSYVMSSIVNNGAISQNSKILNITGSSSTPLTGYGTFDGNLYLNGSTATSYDVQVGLPMGNLYTDRDTKISLDSTRYLRAVPSTTEFVPISIKSIGTESGYAARWTSDSTGPVTYTVTVGANQLYDIWVDHTTRIGVVQTSSDGVVQFTYNGPFSTHEFTVSKSGGPSSNIQASYSYSISGNVVSFTDNSFGGVTMWVWDFGDGTGSTAQSPTHKYMSSGEFVVSLTVYDGNGHSSTAKTTITLELGPDFPFERTPGGWKFWVSDKYTVSVPAVAFLIFGVWFLAAGYFAPLLPILSLKKRKVLGIILLVVAIYWFAIIDNQWLSFSWLKWPW